MHVTSTLNDIRENIEYHLKIFQHLLDHCECNANRLFSPFDYRIQENTFDFLKNENQRSLPYLVWYVHEGKIDPAV